jgi:hypothetical protein
MNEKITEKEMHDIMSISKNQPKRLKDRFRTPPYYCKYLKSSYLPGGAMYREEHEDDD